MSNISVENEGEHQPLLINTIISVETTSLVSKDSIDENGVASPISTIFNLVNTTVGAGIVAIPLVLNQGGIAVGIVLMVLMALLSNYSLHLLISSSHIAKKYSYKDLAIAAFGTWVGPLFETAIVALCFGVCTVFVILIARMVPPQISSWAGRTGGIESNVYLITGLIMLIIVFPLSALKRIQFLSFTSFIAIIGIMYLVGVVFYKFVARIVTPGLPVKDFVWVNSDWMAILNSIPTLVFAYGSHITLLPMYHELKNRSPRKMSLIMNSSILLCLIFYAFVGLCGYLQFADVAPFSDAILDLYDKDDIPVVIARMFIAVVVILSYPLVHYACRASIENIFFSRFKFSWIRWLLITAFITGTTYLLGVLVDRIVIVFGLVMTTAGALVQFVFPFIIYLKLETNRAKKIPAIILLFICVGVSIICFALSVMDTVKGLMNLF
jgi:amino acid permease